MNNSLPQGWDEKELSRIANIVMGQSPKSTSYNELGNGEIFYQGVTDFGEFYPFVKKYTTEPKKMANIDDILFSVRAPVGTLNIANNRCCIGRGVSSLSMKNKENRFLYYLLKFNQKIFENLATGTTFTAVNKKDIENFVVKFPQDINEQKRIADILSAFDDKIELNNQMNQTLEDMATALFKEWFENFNFPNDEGKAYKENGGEFKSSELGEIPIDWEVCKIEDNVEILGGGTPSTKNESYWIGGDINWFSPTDITKSNSMFYSKSAKKININGLNNSSAKEFPPYSLMLTSRATVGEIGINTEAATTNQGFITLIPNERFSLKYLYFWLYSKIDEIHSLASGSTFKEISKRDFKKLKILKFNKQLLDLFEKKVNPIFEKIENNQKENSSLKNLRDELLPKLMSGEKRV